MEEDVVSKHLSSIAMPVATAASWFMAMALASAQEPKRLNGTELFIDLEQYVGKQVILVDAGVAGATNSGAFVRAGRVMFYVNGKDVDREAFQFFLTNCTGRSLFAWPYGGLLFISSAKVRQNREASREPRTNITLGLRSEIRETGTATYSGAGGKKSNGFDCAISDFVLRP